MSKAHQPWMKFFPSDWRSDPSLRVVSIGARGLWMEMLCIMHEATPRGFLVINGHDVTERHLAALTGTSTDEITNLISELESAGVFSRDGKGRILSRRMVRDDKKSKTAKKNGKKGGNPAVKRKGLTDGNKSENSPSVNQQDNPPVKGQDKTHMPEARSQKPDTTTANAAVVGPAAASQDGKSKNQHTQIIKAFDDMQHEIFGPQARGWPHHTDPQTVTKWLADGATPEMILETMRACLTRKHAKGHSPPRAMSLFNDEIADVIRTANTPLPEGRRHEQRTRNDNQHNADDSGEARIRRGILKAAGRLDTGPDATKWGDGRTVEGAAGDGPGRA